MTIQALGPLPFEFRRYLERPSCPRCGDTLLAAEASALIADGHVRHSWSCDSCGHDFETAVQVSLLAAWCGDCD